MEGVDLFDSSYGQLMLSLIMCLILFTAVLINVGFGGQGMIFDLSTKIEYMMNSNKSNDYLFEGAKISKVDLKFINKLD
mgnify:CR=1 FL=1